MVRLYIDTLFALGKRLKVPADELRYFKSVRRSQGQICVFNRQGQEALGQLDGSEFLVEKIESVKLPIHPLTMAIGLPENSVIPLLIRSLSELGVAELIFFEAKRSQAGKARKISSNFERWDRLAIEAARQCGRGSPLRVTFQDLQSLDGFSTRYFFDESAEIQPNISRGDSKKNDSTKAKCLSVIGCEGGWSEEERQWARQRGFEFVHFQTPVLRVETAAICAAFFSIEKNR